MSAFSQHVQRNLDPTATHYPPNEHREYYFEIQVLNEKEKFTTSSPPSIADLMQRITMTMIPHTKYQNVLTKFEWCLWFIIDEKNMYKIQSDDHLKQLIADSTQKWYSVRVRFVHQGKYDGTFVSVPTHRLCD